MTARRLAALVAVAAALWLAGTGVTRGTFAVGGSDSSCYAVMAAALADGAVLPDSALGREAPWPDATRSVAPGGFLPHPDRPGVSVPICAPGFALLLAPAARLHRDAIFLVTPAAAGVLVLLTFVLARRLGGEAAGAMAAVVTALAPIAVFQAVQPMNDVTTAALWMAVAVAVTWESQHRPPVAGLLTGLALLMRPNLLPAGVAAGLCVMGLHGASSARPSWRDRLTAGLQFGVGTLPGGLGVMVLHALVYGSPFRSGYGSMQALFAVSHVVPNLVQHGQAVVATMTPWMALAVIVPVAVSRERRGVATALLGLTAALAIGYLFYQPFREWWYLRFLLPAVVLGIALAAVTTVGLLTRMGLRDTTLGAVVLAVTAGIAVIEVRASLTRGVYDVDRAEARFRHTADAVAQYLPDDIVALTVWESGTLRYWPGRDIVMWDAVEAGWLDRAVDWIQAQGRECVIIVEDWEAPLFRTRFAGQEFGALDWPPRLDVDRRVQVFVTGDRAAFHEGRGLPTTLIRPRR